MNRLARLASGALVAAAATVGVATLSRLPVPMGADEAFVRLTWRFRGEVTETCRRLSQEELERLPAHMRKEEVCERRFEPYRLRVRLDGRALGDEVITAAGARADRPLYVHREFAIAPGSHRLEVSFAPARPSGESSPARQAGEESRAVQGRAGEGTGDATGELRLDRRLELNRGDVALVTYDTRLEALVVRTSGTSATSLREEGALLPDAPGEVGDGRPRQILADRGP